MTHDTGSQADFSDAMHGSEIMAAMAAASLDALITIDVAGNIIEFGPAAERIFGHARADVLGRSVAEVIIPEEMRQQHSDGMARYMKTGHGPVLNNRVEVQAVRSNGERFEAELTVVPIELNKQQYFTAFVRDISEQKKHLQQLEQAKNQAELANESKRLFLSNMSHELKTPLNGILGGLNLLATDNMDAEQTALLAAAKQSGLSLLDMLDHLLAYSSLDGGSWKPTLSRINPVEVMSSLVETYRDEAEKKGLELSFELNGGISELVETDLRGLQLISRLLIDNAIKFTETGCVTVGLSTARSPATGALALRVTVQDTGIGIPPEAATRIFEPFVRLCDGDDSLYAGVGLGLSIAQRLAQRLEARIDFHSAIGKGSCFILEYPMMGSEPKSQAHLQQNNRKLGEGATGPRKVMLVEDGPSNRLIAVAILQSMGFEVQQAEDGIVALELLRESVPDVILMDLRMPRLDGYETTRSIRKLGGRHAVVPIIAVTANAVSSEWERCIDAGMNDFLTKPIDSDLLATRLRYWLEGKHSTAERTGEST